MVENSFYIIIFLGIAFTIIVGLIFIFVYLRKFSQNQNSGTLSQEHERLKQDKNQLEGKLQEQEKQYNNLTTELKIEKSKVENKDQKIREKERSIHELQMKLDQRNKEVGEEIRNLKISTEKLEEEKNRVKEEEKRKQEEIKEKRNKVWKTHQNNVISRMQEISKKRELYFPSYTESNLPKDFSKGPKVIKPDFCIETKDQYVIFDAKDSGNNLLGHVKGEVKGTAKKYESYRDSLYPSIFFVVPTIDIEQMNDNTYFFEGTFHFYVITIEAFEPIIRILKLLENYEFAGKLEPEDREDIIRSIAVLRSQISLQNAVNVQATEYGIEALGSVSKSLPNKIDQDVMNREKQMSLKPFGKTQLQKNLTPEQQRKKIQKFTQPTPEQISNEDIKNTQDIFPAK